MSSLTYSLPYRQLRRLSICELVSSADSLPYRQLRSDLVHSRFGNRNSLPYRQLRRLETSLKIS